MKPLTFIFALLIGNSLCTFGQSTLVVPLGYENKEGESGGGGAPFNTSNPERYQWLYTGSSFASVIPTGGWIKGMSFRVNGSDSLPPPVDVRNLEIRLSSSSKTVQTMSLTYEENVGIDQSVVLAQSSSFTLTATGTAIPRPFDLRITFEKPFFYNPSSGSLLVDWLIHTPFAIRTRVDVPAANSQIKVIGGPLDLGQALGFGPGYITRFEIEPIPEPPLPFIIALGALLMARANFRKRREANV